MNNIDKMIGRVFSSVLQAGDQILFKGEGITFTLDPFGCCVCPHIKSIQGDLAKLVDSPIIEASDDGWEYTFETEKGTVIIAYAIEQIDDYGCSRGDINLECDEFEPEQESREYVARPIDPNAWYMQGKYHREDGPAIEYIPAFCPKIGTEQMWP